MKKMRKGNETDNCHDSNKTETKSSIISTQNKHYISQRQELFLPVKKTKKIFALGIRRFVSIFK